MVTLNFTKETLLLEKIDTIGMKNNIGLEGKKIRLCKKDGKVII